MYLLIGCLIPFIIGRLLLSEPLAGTMDETLAFVILVVSHYVVGGMAWSSHYSGFTNRIAYLLVMTIHTGTYALNWEAYAVPALTADSFNLLSNLMVLGGVLLPSLFLYAGTFVALSSYPAEDEEEE